MPHRSSLAKRCDCPSLCADSSLSHNCALRYAQVEVNLIGWTAAMLYAEPIAAQWLEMVPFEQREARRAAANAEWSRRAEPLWARATAPPTRPARYHTGTSSPDIATSDREDDIIADQEEILADVVCARDSTARVSAPHPSAQVNTCMQPASDASSAHATCSRFAGDGGDGGELP